MMLPERRAPEEDSYSPRKKGNMWRSHFSKKEFEVKKKLLGTSSIWEKSPRPRRYGEYASNLYSSFDTAISRAAIPRDQQKNGGETAHGHPTHHKRQMSYLEQQQALFENENERSLYESMAQFTTR